MKQKNKADKQIRNYLDREFAGIGESQQLFELKEELMMNLKEKVRDYEKAGKTEDEAVKTAINSMGDLSGLKEDMRQIGEDHTKKAVYKSMASRISTAGLIVGILIAVFGALTSTMLFFMPIPGEAVFGPAIFIVVGGALITYSVLTRETAAKYAMNKIRALLYAVAIGILLFSMYVGFISGSATGEVFVAISSFMMFFIIGLGLLLGLLFSKGTDRKK
ncbi:permease prefix domain 1-containing protein [Thalassobacillus sp. CUG 92003]|uniref:permease prefix domain 1-containing protein n=1 Tax=Thalassobacillus sp. CUG 92003 TaxID=2736641 RepID=UPI0015E7C18F|nr:permease prefix domain 1-containing protein [Thalassobacillus sp. CUG 92003]